VAFQLYLRMDYSFIKMEYLMTLEDARPFQVLCGDLHREKFSKTYPCEHYRQYGYEPNSNEKFFIKLIIQNYNTCDWYTRKNRIRKSDDKMKKSTCAKCNAPVHNMSKKQQLLHEKMHLQEKNQNIISEFF